MSFSWPFLRELKHELGELDAGCQLSEVAVREMLSQAEASGDAARAVRNLAVEHGIPVNSSDPSVVRGHLGKLYVLSVTSSLERFLRRLSRSMSDIGPWPDTDESLLSKARAWVGMPVIAEYLVCEYYWAVRNAIVHLESGNVKRPLPRDLPSNLPDLDAPNGVESLRYDDFILYTASAKRLAFEFSIRSRPSDTWLADKAVLALSRSHGSETPERYRRRLAN